MTEIPHILDSGERRQFETGAVRDIQDGKGRCDLMPLEVVAKILNGDSLCNPDLVVGRIALFKNSDYRETTHLYGALFHFAERWPERRLDMTSVLADIFLEVAKHFEEGSRKYGENNWQKGLPVNRYIDSAVRHYLKWLRGDKDEPHDRAFVWNIMCCIWEVDFSPRATSKNEQDAPVMVLEHATGPCSGKVSYLCDRRACPTCDNPQCHHTQDINHAINFECIQIEDASGGHKFVERRNSRLLLKDAVPGVYETLGFVCLKGKDSNVYNMATGRLVDITGLSFCQRLSIGNAYPGKEGLTLSTAPGGALFYHKGDAWLATAADSNAEIVYVVRLRDGEFKYLPGTTTVASIEDLDFKPY